MAMKKNTYDIVSNKATSIMACLDALSVINFLDCNQSEVIQALEETLDCLTHYPGINSLERCVLKHNNPDYYVFQVQKLIKQCLSGQSPNMAFHSIIEALERALSFLEYKL